MEDRYERRSRGEGSSSGPMSVEVMLRRFFRDVQQSEIMTEIKKRRFFEKKTSRNKRRAVAQVRAVRRKTKRGY
ncbi:MAG: 30S ribosomal protein S21 [Candidatus Berkelbacteria bacterium]|nr:MAG: 30S ribosomal protein S21 [Candidatus Berkelbacteria bacterium]QQG51409.1 MAG: 30S ribosomal protein S21 [Candidatus Berkelbacteria bacterium]